ncbi:MAG TPA: cation:dicarboxylase symporter family transporter [Vicinamibacterales bacterium]
MSFSRKVIAGLASGVVVGLFLGDYAAIFKWPADGFIGLLQTTVFPYVVVSIIYNLGRLNPPDARRLVAHVGLVIGGLWLLALTFAFLMPLAFPRSQNASFFSTTLLQAPESFDFIGLYVPSNPFHALANSIVPAIVLFSILMGVALMTLERKSEILDVLGVAEAAVSRAARMIQRLTPYGLFAIAANTAGTLNIEQFSRIQMYLVAYAALGFLLGFWIMPGLVAALTGITRRELLQRTHESVITATMAGDVFIVLPSLIDASRDLLKQHDPDPRVAGLPEVIMPAAYNLPHSGKLLSMSFILFAAWYTDTTVGLLQLPRLALTGILTFFGSINVAVPFLLDTFRIPADTFQLFVATSVVNSRVGSFVAAIHTVTVAVLGSAAVAGHLRIRAGHLTRFAIGAGVSTLVVIGGLRLLFATIAAPSYEKDQVIMSMDLLSHRVPALMRAHPSRHDEDGSGASGSLLETIRQRGVLRVGYLPDAMPFAFTNAKGAFVGHDVELAHQLAEELGVTLEFVPIIRDDFATRLQRGECDIVMSGVPITTRIANDALLSNPYLDETLAFVMPDEARHRFETWESIRAIHPLTVTVINQPYYIDKLTFALPGARVVPVNVVSELFQFEKYGADAALLTAERGSTWTLLHPELSVVVPQPTPIKVPLAFAIARHDLEFAAFVNSWIELKRKDGTLDRIYRHWILGADAVPRAPRWSILRNVLHLVS